MSNAETVRGIYESFGRGDPSPIFDAIADDVAWEAWEDNSSQKAGIVYMLPRRGKDGVAEWLDSLSGIEMHSLELRNLLEGGNEIAASIHVEFTVGATGKRFSDDELHLWAFNDEGRITRLRHYTDTAKHIEANTP